MKKPIFTLLLILFGLLLHAQKAALVGAVFGEGACPQEGIYTTTWLSTNHDDNGPEIFAKVTAVIDETPPTINCPENVTIECEDSTLPDDTGWATANDACESSPLIEYEDEYDTSCSNQIIRTWTATDACDNESQNCVQTISVNSNPAISLSMDIVGVDYPTTGDDCSGNFDVIMEVTVTNSGNVDLKDVDIVLDLESSSNDVLVGLINGSTNESIANLAEGASSTFNLQFEVAPESVASADAIAAVFEGNVSAYANCVAVDSQTGCSPVTADANVQLGNCWQTSRTAAANDLINVNLIDCSADITPDMMLENHIAGCDTGDEYPLGGFYRIRILEPGQIEPGAPQLYATVNTVTTNYPDDRVIVYIENVGKACQSLWGVIQLEDKTPPSISCPDPVSSIGDDDLLCSDIDDILGNAGIDGLPNASSSDNCGNPVLTFEDNVEESGDCSEPVMTLTRTWTATDGQSRTATCDQMITFRNPTLEEVTKPTDELQVACDFEEALLAADEDLSIEDLYDDNGHPTPYALELLHGQGAGFPYIGNNVLNESYCNIGASYDDIAVIEVCGNTVKIVRQWTIIDWCDEGSQEELNNGTTVNHRQIIKFGDFSAPVLTGPGDKIYVSTGPFGCYGILKIPDLDEDDISENCSADLAIDANLYKTTLETTYDRYGRETGTESVTVEIGSVTVGEYVSLEVGPVYTITYAVSDECGNVSNEVDLDVEVRDEIEPVAVCDDDLHISIGGEQIARITAADVDEGSWDNCGPVDTYISRKLASEALRDAYLTVVYELSFDDLEASTLPDDDKNSPAEIWVKKDTDEEILRIKNGMWYTWWDQEVYFLCEDTDERVTIELLAVDGQGLTNICWNDVLIEDKIAPYCEAPANIDWDCTELPYGFDPNDDDQLAELFGSAYATDNCSGATAAQISSTVVEWNCNSGTITRTFQATDAKGKTSNNTCTQTINISRIHNYEMVFPADPEPVVCGEASLGELITNVIACDLLSVNIVNDTFTASNDACYKIRRTFSVINWCEYDGEAPAVVISRDEDNDDITGEHDVYVLRDADGVTYIDDDADEKNTPLRTLSNATGYWTYIQYIKVVDNIAPEVTIGGDDLFCSINADCNAEVTIPFTVTDECAGDDVEVKAFVDGDQVEVGGEYPNYSISGDYVIGEYELEVHAIDGCQNTELTIQRFRVADCKAPAPICINGLAIELMPTEDNEGIMAIWASDFSISGLSDCVGEENITLSINRVGETPDITSNGLILTCADLDTLAVEIYAWDNAFNPTAMQPDGTIGGPNYDHCVSYVVVQDNMFNLCGAPAIAVAGLISTEYDEPVEDVEVHLSGAQSMDQITLVDGSYVFQNLPIGGDYTISPRKTQDYLNGVSTFDIVLITKHVLGTSQIDSPYRLIAADINRSNTVSTLDLIQLRKLVLSVDVKFRNNTSWRFVPASYDFPKPDNPWSTPFPEVFSVNDISQPLRNTDFVAIKIGDLNATANANSLITDTRDIAGLFEIQVADQQVTAGNEYRITFTAKQMNIQGYQFTLQHEGLELIDIEYGIAKAGNFGVIDEGIITTSWNVSDNQLGSNQELFTLVLHANQSGDLSDLLRISSRYTLAEAYNQSDELLDVNLDFGTSTEGIASPMLYQNVPNPFQGQTVIGFELPIATQATISIQDVTGKTLKLIRGEYDRGYNQIQLNSNNLPGNGLLYYTLSTDDYTETKKMIVTSGF